MNITIKVPVSKAQMAHLKFRAGVSAKHYYGGRGNEVECVTFGGYVAGDREELLTLIVDITDPNIRAHRAVIKKYPNPSDARRVDRDGVRTYNEDALPSRFIVTYVRKGAGWLKRDVFWA